MKCFIAFVSTIVCSAVFVPPIPPKMTSTLKRLTPIRKPSSVALNMEEPVRDALTNVVPAFAANLALLLAYVQTKEDLTADVGNPLLSETLLIAVITGLLPAILANTGLVIAYIKIKDDLNADVVTEMKALKGEVAKESAALKVEVAKESATQGKQLAAQGEQLVALAVEVEKQLEVFNKNNQQFLGLLTSKIVTQDKAITLQDDSNALHKKQIQ